MIPVAVVVEVVVTSQSCESSQTDGVREEHLCTCINPHLSSKAAKVLATCLLNGDKICSFFKKKNKQNKQTPKNNNPICNVWLWRLYVRFDL